MAFCRVIGDKELLRELKRLKEGVLKDHVYQALRRATDKVRGEAKRRAPIDTGRLRFSITSRTWKNDLTGVVYADYPKNRKLRKTTTKKQQAGTPDYYAFAIEYGTRHAPAQPFIAPAVKAKRNEVKRDLLKAMTEAVPNDKPAKA